MDRGERERWNKLSSDSKGVARAMAKYADTGRVHMNDLRMDVDMSAMDSTAVAACWAELESRAYGVVAGRGEADPVFVMNVPAFQTLAQSRRLDSQAPHRPGE